MFNYDHHEEIDKMLCPVRCGGEKREFIVVGTYEGWTTLLVLSESRKTKPKQWKLSKEGQPMIFIRMYLSALMYRGSLANI